MSKELGVIGSEPFVLGFQLAGVQRAVRAQDDEYQDAVERMLEDPDVGILIVNSRDVDALPAQARQRLTESVDPVVIQMGQASSGDLREKVKRAIGIDLYKE